MTSPAAEPTTTRTWSDGRRLARRWKAGEVLGYVGNTGNARTTAPHLHFGIYSGGPIDPLPFIEADQDTPPAPTIDLPLGTLARVSAARSTLRRGPAPDATAVATLDRGTVVRLQAATPGRAVRVLLPDDSVGYLPRQTLTASDAPSRRRALAAGAVLRERPLDTAPAVHVLDTAVQAEVLGSFSGYDLVRVSALSGWVLPTAPGRR